MPFNFRVVYPRYSDFLWAVIPICGEEDNIPPTDCLLSQAYSNKKNRTPGTGECSAQGGDEDLIHCLKGKMRLIGYYVS